LKHLFEVEFEFTVEVKHWFKKPTTEIYIVYDDIYFEENELIVHNKAMNSILDLETYNNLKILSRNPVIKNIDNFCTIDVLKDELTAEDFIEFCNQTWHSFDKVVTIVNNFSK
jgi:hypothetical protein